MSRILIVGASIAILSRLVAAQGNPTELIYDTYLTGNTYMLSPPGLNWQAAQAYSRTLGGYLASINDATEGILIYAKYQTHTEGLWIGLSDAQSEGTWVWDSGEPLYSTNWCAGEPNNAGLGEDYAALLIGAGTWCWNDIELALHGAELGADSGDHRDRRRRPRELRLRLPVELHVRAFAVRRRRQSGRRLLERRGKRGAAQGVHLEGQLLELAGERNGVPPHGSQRPRPGSFRRALSAARACGRERGAHPDPARHQGRLVRLGSLRGETVNSLWNDGMSIAVVDANGQLIANLDYADTSTIQTGSNVPTTSFCSTATSFVRRTTVKCRRRGCCHRSRIPRT